MPFSIAPRTAMSSTMPPRQATVEPSAARAPNLTSFVSSLSSFWRSKTNGLTSARLATSATTSSSSSSTTSNNASTSPPQPPPPASHLVVLVHGLYGRPSDWNVIMERLNEHKKRVESGEAGGERWRVLPSLANRRRLTLDGIDECASRLAREVREVVKEEKKLERISFVGHSMGGLIARAALEELLDEDDGAGGGRDEASKTATKTKTTTLAGGLLPAHFISIATPHLGCHADAESTAAFVAAASSSSASPSSSHHPALVPLVGWVASAAASVTEAVGIVGKEFASSVAPRLLAAASSRAAASLGRSGAQFFLLDGKDGDEKAERAKEERPLPLLARLADPQSRAFRALAAFESRTTFANSSGDHLVGWANASLRRPSELPRERLLAATAATASAAASEVAEKTGQETTTMATTTTAEVTAKGRSWSLRRRVTVVDGDKSSSNRKGNRGGGGGRGVVLDDGVAAAFDLPPRSPSAPASSPPIDTKEHVVDVDRMLSSLSSLPWRRVDACFKGSRSYFLSHNHIQATHFFNAKVGFDSADAIARAIVENDEELLRRRREREKEKGGKKR